MTDVSAPRSKRSGYERSNLEWYVEPIWATTLLLEQESFEGPILDPCCSQGNILSACQAAGYNVLGTDLRHRGHRLQYGTRDWFGEGWGANYGEYNIISNPPYGKAKLATEFIERALLRTRQTVAVVVNESYLFAKSRHDLLYGVWPLKRIWMLSSRPSMPPGGEDIKATGGQANYAWLVFDRQYSGEPTVGWLRSDPEFSIPIRKARADERIPFLFSPR